MENHHSTQIHLVLEEEENQKNRLSVYYPQNNGRADAGIKTAKRILLGNVNSATMARQQQGRRHVVDTQEHTMSTVNKRESPQSQHSLADGYGITSY